MKYIVTGGAGFIGSNLVDKLMENNPEKLTVIDNLRAGRANFIEVHSGKKNFGFVCKDIKLVESFPDESYDWVFHLAANADVRRKCDWNSFSS